MDQSQSESTRYGLAALNGEIDRLQLSTRGFRHFELFRSGAALGNVIAGGELTRPEVERELLHMADLLSLPKSDAIRTVKNGIDRGMRTPRSAKNLSMEPKDRGDTVLMWMRWWQSLDPAKFPGTKGSSLLKTLAGVAMLGMAYGGPVDVGASYRQIAEAAGKRVEHGDAAPPARRTGQGLPDVHHASASTPVAALR